MNTPFIIFFPSFLPLKSKKALEHDYILYSTQMMRPGQRGMHISPSAGAMGRDRGGDDGLFPTPRLPSTPMMSGGERKRGRNSADIIGAVAQLSQMGNPESKLALNILNSVLGVSRVLVE